MNILNKAPTYILQKGLLMYGKLLVLQRDGLISWDNSGTVDIGGTVIPSSNISLLVAHAVGKKGLDLPPVMGFPEFARFAVLHIEKKLLGYRLAPYKILFSDQDILKSPQPHPPFTPVSRRTRSTKQKTPKNFNGQGWIPY
jgi:hypothetical protein